MRSIMLRVLLSAAVVFVPALLCAEEASIKEGFKEVGEGIADDAKRGYEVTKDAAKRGYDASKRGVGTALEKTGEGVGKAGEGLDHAGDAVKK